jgi:hypothetical protein
MTIKMRRTLQRTGAALGVTLVAAIPALAATTGTDSRAELRVALATTNPGQASGLDMHVLYKHPDDPRAKPPPLTKASFALPAGTLIDNGARPRCTATDDEFQLLGRGACPAESQVGTGTLAVMEGLPSDPSTFDTTFFNGDGEIVELVSAPGTNVTAGLDRLKIGGSTLTANPPSLPGGPPDGRTAVREINAKFDAGPAGARPYIVSPRSCPDSGAWTSRGSFEFADGGASTVDSTTPCTAPAPARGPAALSLTVAPRTVRAGAQVRFNVTVHSVSARCRRGVTVRLGLSHAVTGDDGRAVLRATLRRPGTARVRASNPDCSPAAATVRVLRKRAIGSSPRLLG